jgi:hypothetical protein
LSVFDWLGSVAQVVLENFGASSPDPRANSILERALPFAFQQTKAFVGVDLCVVITKWSRKCFIKSNFNDVIFENYDGSNGADDLDGVASLRWVETGLFQQKLSCWQGYVRELSVDPTAAFGAVVSAHEDFASLVHEVLPAELLVVQVNWVVCLKIIWRVKHEMLNNRSFEIEKVIYWLGEQRTAAEGVEQDVNVILETEFVDAGAWRRRGRFNVHSP